MIDPILLHNISNFTISGKSKKKRINKSVKAPNFPPREDNFLLDVEEFRTRVSYIKTLMELRTNGVEVHVGYDNLLKEKVAVKFIHTTKRFADFNKNSLAQFENELLVLKNLARNNENKTSSDSKVQELLYHVETQKVRIMVTRYLEGGDLMDWVVEKNESAPQENVVAFLYKTTSLLYKLHMKGIAHRDIKPDNIFLRNTNDITNVTLGDFGHAAVFDVRKGTPFRQERVGTQPYVAPEIVEYKDLDEIPMEKRLTSWVGYDPRLADVFSLGVTAYCLLTASFPYETFTRRELKTCFVRLNQKKVSPELKEIIMGMMALRPEDRFTTEMVLTKLYDLL